MEDQVNESVTPEAPAATPEAGTNGAEGAVQGSVGEAAEQSATTDPGFIPKDVDINTLPPEQKAYLEKVNRDMVRGFTEKTESLAEERRKYSDYDDHRQKSETLDQLLADERIANYLRSLNEPAQDQITEEELSEAQTDPRKFQELVDRAAGQKLATIKEQTEQVQKQEMRRQASELIDAYSSATDSKTGSKLRPDFDELGNVIELFLAKNPPKVNSVAEWKKSIDLAYTSARAWADSYVKKGEERAANAMKARASNATEQPGNSVSSDVETMKDPNSVSEALDLARRRKRVARNF